MSAENTLPVEETSSAFECRLLSHDKNIPLSPRRERVKLRNRVLAARYYYWTEICRRREDDVRRLLCDNEFFVEERTISNALLEQNAYLSQLIACRATRRELRRLYPGFDWSR